MMTAQMSEKYDITMGLLQKELENSEITIYERTSPGVNKEVSPDFFKSLFFFIEVLFPFVISYLKMLE